MQTKLQCIPCFFQQVLQAGSLLNVSPEKTKSLMDSVGSRFSSHPPEHCPLKIARFIQARLVELTGDRDPYREIKDQSNELAMQEFDLIKDWVNVSVDPLLTSVKLACAGTIIDYGIARQIDPKKEISDILQEEDQSIARESPHLFACDAFRKKTGRSPHPSVYWG